MINYDSFYAVIVICIVLFVAVVSCVGMRLFRRTAPNNVQNQTFNGYPLEEWPRNMAMIMNPIDDEMQRELNRVQSWQNKYPPQTTAWVDTAAETIVRERGVAAWTFVESEPIGDDTDQDSNAAVVDKTNLMFAHGEGCLLTNLALPVQEFVYWEVKVLQLSEQDRLAIGLATKPYPAWRLPGYHKHSVAYHSQTGAVHATDPLLGRPYGPPFGEGDVIGVGYLTLSSTVFFVRNGENLGKACIGFRYPVYPAIGARGPCQVSVNFGQQDFLFTPANLRHAGLAPKQGELPPPPAYGDTRDTIMLFGNQSDTNNPHLDYSVFPPLATQSLSPSTSSPPNSTAPQTSPPPHYT